MAEEAGAFPKDLSVVIVSWNVAPLLRECLAALYGVLDTELAKLRCEVFVVDNASVDGSAEMVAREFPRAQLIANARNYGFARANNQALRRCAGRYLLLLNPDTLVHEGALLAMLRFLVGRNNVGAVGPRMRNADGTTQGSYSNLSLVPSPDLLLAMFLERNLPREWRYRIHPNLNFGKRRRVKALSGACLLLPAAVMAEVGLLDENLFLYGEEFDLCYRLRRAGFDLVYLPDAEITHYGSRSVAKVRWRMLPRMLHSHFYVIRKHIRMRET
jgi:GT2 family glycosyltransferase